MPSPRRKSESLATTFDGMRADYSAAKTGRLRRRRTGLSASGSHADYHYRSDADYLRIMEYARDMDRNDPIFGQMFDRATINTIQNGLTPDPKTGDEEANKAIRDAWYDRFAGDAVKASLDGAMTFTDIEETVFRSMLVDGDIFVLPTDEGPLELIEAHRCRTPGNTDRNCVHGVLLDERRRRLQYWFTKEDIDAWAPLRLVSEVTKRDAFDADGNPSVLHIRNWKRSSQTRGVTAAAPIFDLIGLHDDIHFAELVKRQIAACVAFIRNRGADFTGGEAAPMGKQMLETFGAQKRLIEELAPGVELDGLPGETIQGFSPNIQGDPSGSQIRQVLQLIGLNLGLPLVLLLMDASDTNFSGWRGAVDQARMGFKRNQGRMIEHFHTPVYRWKLRQFVRDDPKMRALEKKLGNKFYAHEWNAPKWPYIQPLQDAQADDLRQKRLMTSPRRLHNERSQDWNDIITETVEDNATAIEKAALKAKELSTKIGDRVTWRELLFMTDPDMLKAITTSTALGPNGAPLGQNAAGPTSTPLNGAQITAAVDLFSRLRAGNIAGPAAEELLVGIGLDRDRAQAAIAATDTHAGQSSDDQTFIREVLKALLNNPTTLSIVANSIDLGPTIDKAGLPRFKEYVEPFVPVVAPPGNLVSGNVITDGAGDVVGGGLLAAPANTVSGNSNGSPPPASSPTAAPEGTDAPAKEDPAAEEDAQQAKPPASPPAADEPAPAQPAPTNDGDGPDPEDDPKDPEDQPTKEGA